MATHTWKLIDMCAGAGMLGLGVHAALGESVQTLAYVERESYAAATLVARMEDKTLDQAPVWDDVNTCAEGEFIDFVRQFDPLMLCAGYPCQPFSFAGKRHGERDPRHLWPAILRFIEAAQPEVVFLENVPGHLRMGYGTVRRNLIERGYRVAEGLFSAAEVGASHRRIRLFILAVADTNGCGRREQSYCRIETTRADFGVPSERMADTENTDGRSEPETAWGDRRGLAGNGGVVADTHITRLEGRSEPIRERSDNRAIGQVCAPLFAPGPGDTDAWQRILAIDPSPEPAICRVPDGLASRMDADRLRLTGNGVVPLAAAYAFLHLWADLAVGKE